MVVNDDAGQQLNLRGLKIIASKLAPTGEVGVWANSVSIR
jgi:hypothetical protein